MEGTVPVRLGDRERLLRFDINALADADQLLRTDLAQILQFQSLRVGDLRILLWAGLKWEEPRLTLQRAGELLEEAAVRDGGFTELATRVLEAITACRIFKRAALGNGQPEATAIPSASGNGSDKPS